VKTLPIPKQYFLFFTLVGIVILQGFLAFFSLSPNAVCNDALAWPLTELRVTIHGLVTGVMTGALFFWAWKSIGQNPTSKILPLVWAFVLSAGVSHTVERLVSECVLDYWHFPPLPFWFNVGDVFLAAGAVGLAWIFWQQSK
jgi:lipoprotein signal peptidase